MPIKICQLLCPRRHCLFAIAFDPADHTDDEAFYQAARTWKEMRLSGVNSFCGICRSHTLSFEIGVTRFKTIEEATPALLAIEEAQLLAR